MTEEVKSTGVSWKRSNGADTTFMHPGYKRKPGSCGRWLKGRCVGRQATVTRQTVTAISVCRWSWRILLLFVIGSSPEGVVVDATAKLLFYTDNGRNTINVARTDNSRDHLVLITYAKHPRTIQIDPIRRCAAASVVVWWPVLHSGG